jgi:hypothetical protein
MADTLAAVRAVRSTYTPLGARSVLAGGELPMADKSPRQTSSKKSGKSLKEKRAEKKEKKDSKSEGFTPMPHR